MPERQDERLTRTLMRLERLYKQAGPRIGCLLVDANALLILADLRASNNLTVFEPTEEDRALIPTLSDERLRFNYAEAPHKNANGREMGILLMENLTGYAALSERTTFQGIPAFDAATGWEGWKEWMARVFAGFGTSDDEETRMTRWIGFVLGYPDVAVEDACQAIRNKSYSQLVDVDIPAVLRYNCAQPTFDYAPEHQGHPAIEQTRQEWQALLESVYASDVHARIAADPAFREARRLHDQPGCLPRYVPLSGAQR